MKLKTLAAMAALTLAAGYAIAEEAKPADGKMNHDMTMMASGMPKGDQGPSSMAYAKANAAMHGAMDIDFSGNPDADFAKSMIPHHQGAVEMAKIELQYGTDPQLRKLAEGIISAQESEIKFMNEWLSKNTK